MNKALTITATQIAEAVLAANGENHAGYSHTTGRGMTNRHMVWGENLGCCVERNGTTMHVRGMRGVAFLLNRDGTLQGADISMLTPGEAAHAMQVLRKLSLWCGGWRTFMVAMPRGMNGVGSQQFWVAHNGAVRPLAN